MWIIRNRNVLTFKIDFYLYYKVFQTKTLCSCAKASLILYFSFHLYVLTTLSCGPDNANHLSQVSAALSPLQFLFGSYLSRFSLLYYTVIYVKTISQVKAFQFLMIHTSLELNKLYLILLPFVSTKHYQLLYM